LILFSILIYENNNSVENTYRIPGRTHTINQLRVFEIIDNPINE